MSSSPFFQKHTIMNIYSWLEGLYIIFIALFALGVLILPGVLFALFRDPDYLAWFMFSPYSCTFIIAAGVVGFERMKKD